MAENSAILATDSFTTSIHRKHHQTIDAAAAWASENVISFIHFNDIFTRLQLHVD